MIEITTTALDTGKSVLKVHSVDAGDNVVFSPMRLSH